MSLQAVSEDIDYELIPCDDVSNEQAWDVRILRGDFIESVIRFGNLKVNEEQGCLNFNFLVVSSPDADVTEDNIELQEYAGVVLESILENAIANRALLTKEHDED
jgi:hypothetical protein